MVMGDSWFAVQSQAHAEEKAARHLGNQGFKAYLPRYRRRIRHARRNMMVLRPLFPGYLFVNLDPEMCRWRAVNGTIGVREILTNGDVPLAVPDAIIAEIMAREDETGAVKLAPPSFLRGQTVRLLEGPLADMNGLFEEMRDETRAVLLVSLLGRQVRMQVSIAAVTAAA
jgi:transcriptional antiterminator RfaH